MRAVFLLRSAGNHNYFGVLVFILYTAGVTRNLFKLTKLLISKNYLLINELP